MSGTKGHSGRTTDPDARRARQLAGRAGGYAKGGHKPPDDDPDAAKDAEPCDDDILALLPGKNPYDHVVLKTKGRFSYLDGKTREQVNGETLANEKRGVELAQARGELLTIKDVEARDERADEIIFGHLDTLVGLVGSLVPPEKATEARAKARAWLTETRAKIAQDLADARK